MSATKKATDAIIWKGFLAGLLVLDYDYWKAWKSAKDSELEPEEYEKYKQDIIEAIRNMR